MANATIALPAANSPQFNDRVKQLLETREGLRGNELDRFIKFGDLVDQEFINSLAAKYPTPITKTDKNGYIGDIYLHPPINLSIVAGAFSNVLTWAVSASQRVYYYEIRVAEVVADSPAPAVTDFTRKIIVTHPGFSCTDAGLDPANTDYYYWIRAVDFSGEHFSAWVEGNILVDVVMRNTIEHVLDVLRGGYPDNYAAGTRYYLDDQVYYVTNGRAYICINDNSGAGILGVVPTDTTKWRRSGILFVGDVDGVPMVGIDGSMVVDGTVYARHLAASIVTANHINGGAFGTLTLTSGKIIVNAPSGLEINSATGLVVKTGGGIEIQAGGDLHLVRTAGNTSYIAYYYGTTRAAEIWMSGSTQLAMNPYTDGNANLILGTASKRFGQIYMQVTGNIYVYAASQNQYGHFRMMDGMIQLAPSSRIDFWNGSSYTARIIHDANYYLYIQPLQSASNLMIGSSGLYWQLLYLYAGTPAVTSSWNIISDADAKKDIEIVTDPLLGKLLQLQAKSYSYKDKTEKEIGFVAQDVQPLFPNTVRLLPAPEGDKTGDRLALIYDHITVINTKCIAEQQGLIDALAGRVEALESITYATKGTK